MDGMRLGWRFLISISTSKLGTSEGFLPNNPAQPEVSEAESAARTALRVFIVVSSSIYDNLFILTTYLV